MSNKKLTILGLIAVVMVILAVVQSRIANRSTVVTAELSYLIQGLNPDKIAQIEIKSSDKNITLRRAGTAFVVTNKDNYPAQSDKINELFSGLMDIKTAELITSDSANYADLEVNEETAQNVVKLLDKDQQPVTGVVIGKRAEGGNTYVRLSDSDDVYLASDAPWIRSSAMDYIDQQLIQTQQDNITSVTVTDANGISYTLESKPDSSEITLAGQLPLAKKLSDNHETVFSAVAGLSFDNVIRETSAGDLTFNRTYICKLADSTVYIIKIAESLGKTYAQCSADFADKREITIDRNKQESEEELKKKEAKLLAREAVDKLNKKCKGWVYIIPSHRANNLTMGLDKLLEDIEPAKEEEPNSL